MRFCHRATMHRVPQFRQRLKEGVVVFIFLFFPPCSYITPIDDYPSFVLLYVRMFVGVQSVSQSQTVQRASSQQANLILLLLPVNRVAHVVL